MHSSSAPAPTVSRRRLLPCAATGGALLVAARAASAAVRPATPATAPGPGRRRLSVAALQQWEAMRFGMFIHLGMRTFVGAELPDGTAPSTRYSPDRLDVLPDPIPLKIQFPFS